MNHIYKKLMQQHGGSIPFRVLGGAQSKITKKTTKRKSKRDKHKRVKHKKTTKKLQTNKYSVGTIIRQGNKLVKLSTSRKWIKI